jgi:hypothetical protein
MKLKNANKSDCSRDSTMPTTPAAIHVQPCKLPTYLDYAPTLNSTFLVLLEWYRSRYNKLLTCVNIVYMLGI